MIALFLLVPIFLIFLAQKISVLDKLGVVPLAVLTGFGFALALNPVALWGEGTQQNVAEVSVALALPLIIFAADLRGALRDARGAGLAIGLAFVAVVIAALIGVLVFRGRVDALPQVAALATGAYSGSGMNMGAINTAIDGDTNVFLTLLTYDIVFSALYMLVVLVAGQRIAGLILRPYQGPREAEGAHLAHLADDSARSYNVILRRDTVVGSLIAVLAAALCVGLGVAAGSAVPEGASSTVTILMITTLGLIGSMIPALHRIRSSFPLGMVLICVFVFASGTMLDTRIFTDMDLGLGGFFLFVIFGSMLIQALLSKIFGIDRDTYLIASGAAVMSVPFIPVIAGAIRNRALLVPGLAIAIIGYAVGNYLGIAVAQIARILVGG